MEDGRSSTKRCFGERMSAPMRPMAIIDLLSSMMCVGAVNVSLLLFSGQSVSRFSCLGLEKVYMSPRPPPKISLKHDWKRELGSEDAQRPEGQVVQQSRSSQSNQPIPNSSRVAKSHDRTGQLVVKTDKSEHARTTQDGRKTSRSQEIDTFSFHEEAVKTQTRSSDDSKSLNVEMAHNRTGNPLLKHTDSVPDGSQTRSFHESISFNVGDETIHDRTGQPVVNHDELSHEQTMLNEVNIDFRIPGLPHSVVKQVESSRFRELVQKIENHPDRHALQQDQDKTKPTTRSVRSQSA